MIARLYHNYLKNKFFNKLIFTYTALIMVILSLLAVIILRYFFIVSENEQVSKNKQILGRINAYFYDKCQLVNFVVEQMYLYHAPETMNFLFDIPGSVDQNNLNALKAFDKFFDMQLSSDQSLKNIFVYKESDISAYLFSKNSLVNKNFYRDSDPEITTWLTGFKNRKALLQIIPTHYTYYPVNSKSLTYIIAVEITNYRAPGKYATIMFDFDTNSMFDSYVKYDENLSGYAMILTPDGQVVFDSSGRYYTTQFPYMDQINTLSSTIEINGENCIVNTIFNSSLFIAVSIIPESDLAAKNSSFTRIVLIVYVIVVLIIFLVTYFGSRLFSKRLTVLRDVIKSGDITRRIPVAANTDEISEISVNLNNLYDTIDLYINTVYRLEIKQKHAQLSMLQSQINPHFLYNTLEAIRMRAIKKGNEDIGNMICLLASLFRNSIKEEMIITIENEITYSKMYLDLFDIRYANKLTIEFIIDEDILGYGILKHLLQPVIENYIIHGFDSDRDDNLISIHGYKSGNDIYIVCSDNGNGIEPNRLAHLVDSLDNPQLEACDSVGLPNVNERIKIVYGKEYGVFVKSENKTSTTVTLKIKAITREDMKKYVECAAG